MFRPLPLRFALVAAFVFACRIGAQDETPYRTPSAALAAIVDAPLPPLAALSPDRSKLLMLERSDAPSIADLAAPELRLAGLRINPATNGPSRAISYTGLVLKPLDGSAERRIAGVPKGAHIADYEWSRDAQHIAFTLERDGGIELWLADVTTASARKLTGPILNAVFGEPMAWVDDSTLVIRRVPEIRGAPPQAPRVPSGPIVQENLGRRAAARTYEDLLADPHDEALFEYYATAELGLVSLEGTANRVAEKALYTRVAPSPDGHYILVESLHRPYSYLVPAGRFPTRIEILERGRPVHLVADLPLNEGVAAGAVRPGPRSVTWRSDQPATISWVQALDRGVADSKAPRRDAWMIHPAPFGGAPVEQQKFEYRIQSITWGDDSLALVTESWQRTRALRTWRIDPGHPGAAPELLFERSSQDRYKDPGRPLMTRNALGRLVLQRSADGGKLYFSGAGASPEGDRPFLDEFDLKTKQTRRLWRSEPPHYEEFLAFTDATLAHALTRRESATDPGGYFVRTLPHTAGLGASDAPVALAAGYGNPYPQFAGARSELIHYKRADGVALSGTLWLPPGYTPDRGPLPTLIWAYPREYLNAETAEQVNAAPERFTRIAPTGPLPFLLDGFAVLNDPAMPIIGRNGRPPNDDYIEQLVASAKAAIDELARRGVTDPKRVAIGGHSYGAFMTANLLAHSRLFRAGIARSGAYNRTLTPFGFQSEQRSLWQAPAVYTAMSPFNFADRVKDPLLLIHGEADNNAGTFPIQSERFYNALKGNGATTRFVLLPHEAHGYRARESLLHMLWEMETWLNNYVKPAVAQNK